ncbi:DUF6053 domain-containing protein [Lysobacter enzymogenes]|uniref:DUF6053 domain-containing protein n=1 Tax=Lysobacter enzymogenes TaxID=69 RepID=UPI003CCE3486
MGRRASGLKFLPHRGGEHRDCSDHRWAKSIGTEAPPTTAPRRAPVGDAFSPDV